MTAALDNTANTIALDIDGLDADGSDTVGLETDALDTAGLDAHAEFPSTALVAQHPGSRPPLARLVSAAINGNQAAWSTLVARYAPLVRRVARQYRLGSADADDLHQILWLQAVQHLRELRNPEALPGWISSTASREAMRMVNSRQRTELMGPLMESRIAWSGFDPTLGVEDAVIRADRRRAIRAGMAELAPEHSRLLVLLVADPPMSYRQISERLGVPVGSIGPTRARCLRKLAATAAMRALLA
jgi:RNA polymerase sigma factor (sigma-70 family)